MVDDRRELVKRLVGGGVSGSRKARRKHNNRSRKLKPSWQRGKEIPDATSRRGLADALLTRGVMIPVLVCFGVFLLAGASANERMDQFAHQKWISEQGRTATATVDGASREIGEDDDRLDLHFTYDGRQIAVSVICPDRGANCGEWHERQLRVLVNPNQPTEVLTSPVSGSGFWRVSGRILTATVAIVLGVGWVVARIRKYQRRKGPKTVSAA